MSSAIFITVFFVVIIARNLILRATENAAKLCLAIMLLIVKTIKVSEEIDYDRSLGVFKCR